MACGMEFMPPPFEVYLVLLRHWSGTRNTFPPRWVLQFSSVSEVRLRAPRETGSDSHQKGGNGGREEGGGVIINASSQEGAGLERDRKLHVHQPAHKATWQTSDV